MADAQQAGIAVDDRLRQQLVQINWQEDLGSNGAEVILGRCDRVNEKDPNVDQRFRTIRIRKPDAEGFIGRIKMDDLTLKTIVYHELGHCLHDFHGHLPVTSQQIMSAELPSDRRQAFASLLQQHFQLMKKQNHAE